MGKVKWSIGADEPEDLESYDVYDGDLPPKGVYNCKLTRLKLKTNRNGDDMINGLLLIEEEGGKKKYNGYGIWFNQNVTEQGAPYVKQFLRALGLTWKDFIGKTVTDDEDPPNITKIGTLKMSTEPEVRVLAKRGSYNGEDKLDVQTWLVPRDEDDDADDADDADGGDDDTADDSGDEPPF